MAKKTNQEIAQKYAESKGFENIQEATAKARELLNSEDSIDNRNGLRIAQETINDLLLLMLRQEVIDNPLPDYMNLQETAFDGFMKEGNAKEYIATLPTGNTTFNNTKFVPTEQTMQKLEKWTIQIYTTNSTTGNKELSAQGYQFKKELTIPVNEWLPYFKNNSLNEYISQKQKELNDNYKRFIFAKWAAFIADNTKGKVVNGTATNSFDAFQEIAVHIDKMMLWNSEYNNDQNSKVIYTPRREDLLMFCSSKTRSMLRTGIKSQTFNESLFRPADKLFNDENLHVLGNTITATNQSTIITLGNEFIDDDTFIVVDVSRIRHIVQVDEIAVQDFAANLTRYVTKDVWGAIDIMPWAKKLVYINTNLNTQL